MVPKRLPRPLCTQRELKPGCASGSSKEGKKVRRSGRSAEHKRGVLDIVHMSYRIVSVVDGGARRWVLEHLQEENARLAMQELM